MKNIKHQTSINDSDKSRHQDAGGLRRPVIASLVPVDLDAGPAGPPAGAAGGPGGFGGCDDGPGGALAKS